MDRNKIVAQIKSNREIIVAGFKFLAIIGISFFALTSKFIQIEVVDHFNNGIAQMAAAVVRLIGIKAIAVNNSIQGDYGAIKIVNECNGLYVTALLAAAILATPSSMMSRTIGVACASLLIYVINLTRAAVLFYLINFKSRAAFDFFHVYVFEAMVVVAVLAIFMVWTGWAIPKNREVHG